MNKFLITGVDSGIGKFLYQKYGDFGLNRQNSYRLLPQNSYRLFPQYMDGFDVIIHCAFSSKQNITLDSLSSYVSDNVGLTEKLLAIPHKKFIFFSTVDVYPKTPEVHCEEEKILIDSVSGIYPISKLVSEAFIKERSNNYLILRCSGLLGSWSRKNNLLKIIQDVEPQLSLTPDSEFNVVLYEDVSKFIADAITQDYQGVYNVASFLNIEIAKLVEFLGKNVQYGKFLYRVTKVDTHKVQSLNSVFKKSSLENICEFLMQLEGEKNGDGNGNVH